MTPRPYLLHALSPLHAGTGQSLDVIDLPIARVAATGQPFVPGSSVKGVLREARHPEDGADESPWLATFGPRTGKADEHAGALIVGDALLLALPVRSFFGTFAWVTSPRILLAARRDLDEISGVPEVPDDLDGAAARVGTLARHRNVHEGKVYLVDLDLPAAEDALVGKWGAWLAERVYPARPKLFSDRFVLVDDETMTFLYEHAVQVDARVRLDPARRTVAKGALWLEESLPPETVLLGLMAAERAGKHALTAEQVLDFALPAGTSEPLQFGGKRSVGRGRCRILDVGGAS